MDYTSVFYAGIILPTIVTVAIFVTFLACWFKYNLKERILGLAHSARTTNIDQNNLTKHVYTQDLASTDIFETASDSAIDVSLHDDNTKTGEGSSQVFPTLSSNTDHGKEEEVNGDASTKMAACCRDGSPSEDTHVRDRTQQGNSKLRAFTFESANELVISPNMLIHHATQGSNASAVTIADVQVHVAPSRLRKGAYPSIDTLVEERSDTSPSKLYERSDRMSEFLHAVRAHTAVSEPIRRPEAGWQRVDVNKQQYAILHPQHKRTSEQPMPAAYYQHASTHNQFLMQNDCNHGDGTPHRQHSRGFSKQSGRQVEPLRQYYSSSSPLTWTPNIRMSTSSNNDDYTAVGISRV